MCDAARRTRKWGPPPPRRRGGASGSVAAPPCDGPAGPSWGPRDQRPLVAPARRRRRAPFHRRPRLVSRAVKRSLPRVSDLPCAQQQVVREESRGPVDAALHRIAPGARRRCHAEMRRPEAAT
eukprot:6175831-Pleurochrysis_carterae.AAC.2